MSGATRSSRAAGSSGLTGLTDVDATTRADRRRPVWRGDTSTGKLIFRDPQGFWIDDYVATGAALDRTGATSGNPAGANCDALNAAYAAATAAGGGRVRLGIGILDFTKTGKSHALELLTGVAGTVSVEGEGQGATIIKQTTTTWGFAHLQSDYVTGATLKNVALRKFTLDHTGQINTFKAGALLDFAGKASLDNLTVEDVDVINMGPPAANGVNRCISISTNTAANQINDPTRYTIGNLTFKRLNLGRIGGGGNCGIGVIAFVNDTNANQKIVNKLYKTPIVANVLIGDITCEDIYWDAGADPTVVGAAAGFQFGGDGLCTGRIRMRRCTAKRSPDVNIELDSTLDFEAEDCRFADAYSEDIFITTWGGPGNPTDGLLEQGRVRFVRTTITRTLAGATSALLPGNLGYPIAICAKGGIQPPSVYLEDVVFERIGTLFQTQSPPLLCTAAPRVLSIKNCAVREVNPQDSMGTSNINRSLLSIQAMGARTHLIIDGFEWDAPDIAVNATAVSASRIWWAINVAHGTDLTFDIKNVTQRFNVAAYTGSANPSVKTKLVSGNPGLGTGPNTSPTAFTEGFGSANTLAQNFDLMAGPAWQTSGGVVTPAAAADVTQETRYRWIAAPDITYYDEVVGRSIDATLQAEFTPGAALASGGVGMQNEIIIKETTDGLNALIGVVGVDGTGANPYLRLDKIVNGVRSTIQSQSPATAPAASTKHTLRVGITANQVTLDLYAGTQGTLTTNATGNDRMVVTLDAATAALLGDNVLGWRGIGGIPAHAAWNVDNAKDFRRSVLRGVFHSVVPKRASSIAEACGFDAQWAASTHRIAGEIALERSSMAGMIGATAVVDMRVNDATLAQQIRARGNGASTAWTPAITPGASPYTYTNTDLTDEIVTVTAGTVSSVQVSRDGGATFITTATATGAEARLRHGDQVKVTYTSAPTMSKSRA